MGHTSFQLNRRAFIGKGVLAGGALALGPAFYGRAFAHGPVSVGPGPYGPLQPFNADGIALPPGFSSREIARGGQPVTGTTYTWHFATDGQATFPTRKADGGPDGGWILVANSEVPLAAAGGASAIEFAPDGKVERAYRILDRTQQNCAGGPTPWGTWLSCEEHDGGRVWECDPTGKAPVVAHAAMGVFSHEAACVDPVREQVYLTEDQPDGCLYRFTPAHYPDLSAGLLELAVPDGEGKVKWVAVPDPGGGSDNPTRRQVPEAAHFNGGEGTWYDEDIVYFTTKGDERVWTYHVADRSLHVMYDPKAVGPDAPLSGVDNITVSPAGEVYVCEDGRDHDICLITPDFQVTRFLKLDPVKHSGPLEPSPLAGNETVGVVFSPDGSRMYFGAQRSFAEAGFGPRGVVYEVTGPFTRPPAVAARDTRPPSVLLGVRPRIRVSQLSTAGLPFRLGLDELSSVDAWLRVPKARGRGVRTIAKLSSPVALRGNVLLRLEPGKAARRAMAGRRSTRAVLTIRAIDAAGNRRVVRRAVRIVRRA